MPSQSKMFSNFHCQTNKIYTYTSFLVCKTLKKCMKTLSKIKTKHYTSKYFHRYFIHCWFSNSPFHIPRLSFSKNNWSTYTFLLVNAPI